MSRTNARLASLLTDEDLPARDAAFVLAVLTCIERRRLLRRIIAHIPVALAIAALLWAGKTFTSSLAMLTLGLPGVVAASAVILTVLFLVSDDSAFWER